MEDRPLKRVWVSADTRETIRGLTKAVSRRISPPPPVSPIKVSMHTVVDTLVQHPAALDIVVEKIRRAKTQAQA